METFPQELGQADKTIDYIDHPGACLPVGKCWVERSQRRMQGTGYC